jgi:hypothetical protein
LQRLESKKEKRKWFLRKTYGNAKAISKRRDSVSALTGRTMEKIAGDKSALWSSDKRTSSGQRRAPKNEPKSMGKSAAIVRPMKATAVSELPEGNEWIYEVKWTVIALSHSSMARISGCCL